MALLISNKFAKKLTLITVFSASLTLVMIAQTNVTDNGIYSGNKLHIIMVSSGDENRNLSLERPQYSTDTGLRKLNIQGESSKESTCNDAATARGSHQFVIAFSYYGESLPDRDFFQGIEENAKLMKKYYPNWLMRVYTNLQPPLITKRNAEKLLTETGITNSPSENRTTKVNEDCVCISNSTRMKQEEMCHLECTYPWLDFCNVENIPGFGNLILGQPQIWRILPMADPLVDAFVSRDLDGQPSEREAAAVQEWPSSNLSFHTMRDHPSHTKSLMGGMWGAVVSTNREELLVKTKEIIELGMNRTDIGQDQLFLKEIIWPLSNGSILQHDSYNCLMFSEHGNMRPWPTQRLQEPYNFVGARIGVDSLQSTFECPSKCRPKDKPKWIYC